MQLRLFFSLCSLLLSVAGYGQDTLRVYSEILQEERTLLIALPESYEGDRIYRERTYPVMVMLDGERLFETARTILHDRSQASVEEVPEMILIGLINTDRRRDMLPLRQSDEHGASRFLAFLEQELLPLIEHQYRASSYRLLAGHSFGGLFATYALLHSSRFQAFLALDPSLWWENEWVVEGLLSANLDTSIHQAYYLARANNPFDEGQYAGPLGVALQHFEEGLNNLHAPKLQYRIDYFPEEDHFSVVLIGLYQGLRYLFQDYRFPLDKLTTQPIDTVRSHYVRVIKRYGPDFRPPAWVFLQIANWLSGNGEARRGRRLLQFLAEHYPNAPLLLNHLGDAYRRDDQNGAALQVFRRVLALDERNEHALAAIQEIEAHNE